MLTVETGKKRRKEKKSDPILAFIEAVAARHAVVALSSLKSSVFSQRHLLVLPLTSTHPPTHHPTNTQSGMDDDYEKANAREWDLNYKAPSTTPKHVQPQTTPPASQRPTASTHIQPTQSGPAKKWPAQQPDLPGRRTNARERRPNESAWMFAEGVKAREQAPEEVPSLLLGIADNAAEAAWRRHERPTEAILVPEALAWSDQHHENIAKKYGTFVTSEGGTTGHGGIRFGIWGEASAVKHTRQEIYDWIKRETPSKHTLGTNAFSKQRSLLPQQRQTAEKKWIQEVRKIRFRMSPPVDIANSRKT